MAVGQMTVAAYYRNKLPCNNFEFCNVTRGVIRSGDSHLMFTAPVGILRGERA